MTILNSNPELDDVFYGRDEPEIAVINPQAGDCYVDIAEYKSYVYNGAKWIEVNDNFEKAKVLEQIKKNQSSIIDDYDRAMKPLRRK